MDNTQFWFIVVQAATAIGTMLVAVVAIWGDCLRYLVASPKLSLSLRNNEGELVTHPDGTKARYYHLVVRNSRAWASAKNVGVFITTLERPGPHGAWQLVGAGNPVPLDWQFAYFLPAADRPIGPERICDLGSVTPGQGFKIATRFTPSGLDSILAEAGKLRIHAVARADNSESPYLTIEIAWNGQWSDGDKEMSRHLVVTQIDRTSA